MKTVMTMFLVAALAACSSTPKEPPKLTGEKKVPVNSATSIAEVMSAYYRAQRIAKAKVEGPKVTERLSIAKALEKFLPTDFKVYAEEGVDLSSEIDYESKRPWSEALGDVLAELDIDMTADLDRRVMSLRKAPLTINQAVEKYVPSEFTVYADDSVNMDALVLVDRSLGWSEAMGKALASVGYRSTINLFRKLVVIKAKGGAETEPAQSTVRKEGAAL